MFSITLCVHQSYMTTYERFSLLDLFNFNFVNADKLTETFRLSFYGDYLTKWGEYAVVAKHYDTGCPMGYILGKAEGKPCDWHSHVSAITVGEPFRKIGLARSLMKGFEMVSRSQKALFADLFVKQSNTLAIDMYANFGYSKYRTVVGYYRASNGSAEDAFEMRKLIDGGRSYLRPPKESVTPDELDWN